MCVCIPSLFGFLLFKSPALTHPQKRLYLFLFATTFNNTYNFVCMLSVQFGFDTNVKRSGHAACWCPLLGGIVQFGGWPPTSELSEVVRHEGSRCPLYVLTAATIARHVRRAEKRRSVSLFREAQSVSRIRRLRRLCDATAPLSDGTCGAEEVLQGKTIHSPVFSEVLSAATSHESSTSSVTTSDSVSARGFVYDEGYVSDVAESSNHTAFSSSGDSSSDEDHPTNNSGVSPSQSSNAAIVAPTITVELLRQAAAEGSAYSETVTHGDAGDDRSSWTAPVEQRSSHTGTTAGAATSYSLALPSHGVDAVVRPVLHDTEEVLGKKTVHPLRWDPIQPSVAPRSRHGHHLVTCGEFLYLIGGSYWAHGNALASTDMIFNIGSGIWRQVASLLPARFCAALAISNGTNLSSPEHVVASPEVLASPSLMNCDISEAADHLVAKRQVVYYFGGLDYTQHLTSTLYRLWLPRETVEELPQYGAAPREQFKGVMVCDIQYECTPEERKDGGVSVGRLFLMDGLPEGRPIVPSLRIYNMATGVWTRLCPAPDIVRSQLSFAQYAPVVSKQRPTSEAATATSAGAKLEPLTKFNSTTTVLQRFEVVGGMPSRRGRQRRSRVCYAFDVQHMRFDFVHALPVPGLTAHCVVLLPPATSVSLPEYQDEAARTPPQFPLTASNTSAAALSSSEMRQAVEVLIKTYGITSIGCGGNEDFSDMKQNSLGNPVGWLYLFGPRHISMMEAARVELERLGVSQKMLGLPKDELLDELF